MIVARRKSPSNKLAVKMLYSVRCAMLRQKFGGRELFIGLNCTIHQNFFGSQDNKPLERKVIVMVRQGNILATAFHAKLTSDTRCCRIFSGGNIYRPLQPERIFSGHKSVNLYADVQNSKPEYQSILHGGGNFSECRSAALKLLDKEKCMHQPCRLGSSFVPKLQGRFLAIENFFYTMKFFVLGSTPVLSDLMLAGQ